MTSVARQPVSTPAEEPQVLVHRDEHWLIRDLKLQDPGPRQGKVRALAKFITRRTADGAWEKVDHGTRKVRPCAAPVDD